MIGTILENRYQILSELGRGGFGITYLAEDIKLPTPRKCVVKQLSTSDLKPQVLSTAKTLFQKEAATLQHLGEHDRIPRLFAYFEAGGQFYLVQEFIEGDDLAQEIYPGKILSEKQTVALLIEILEVLKYVHQQNVIHRDIKPQNIMRRKSDGKIVLIDFGAVKEIQGLAVTTTGQTTSTIAVGTPGYMPHEQAAGQPRFSSDIYALGMIGIEALSGIPASQFPEDPSTGEIVWKNQVHVSHELGRVLDKMVSCYLPRRYQSVDDVLLELKELELKEIDRPEQTGVTLAIAPRAYAPSSTSISPSKSPTNYPWGLSLGLVAGVFFLIGFVSIIANVPKSPKTPAVTPAPRPSQTERPTWKPRPTLTEQPARIKEPTPKVEPAPAPEPVPTVEPIPSVEPGAIEEPMPTTEPGAIEEPMPTTEPGAIEEPMPTTEPGAIEEPMPTTEPVPTVEPMPTVEPAPTPESTAPTPTPEAEPAPTPESTAPAPTPEAEPAPTPESTAPAPTPEAEPAPTPESTAPVVPPTQ
jgi:serine/threonine-protein kinase